MIFWLLDLYRELNFVTALVGCGTFVFAGLLMLVLWVPGYDGSTVAKEHIEIGYVFFGIAVVFLIFGMLAMMVMVALMVIGILYVLRRSLKIVTNKS